MANSVYHPSIEGAQHGAKSLVDFLTYAKRSGAAGAQPSNYMLQSESGFKSAQEIRNAFDQAGLQLDGVIQLKVDEGILVKRIESRVAEMTAPL